MRVVCLVAFESAHEGENGNGARDTTVIYDIAMEKLIWGHDKLIELGLSNFALFVLPVLLFRRNLSIKDASVKDLEGDVEYDQDCQ